jgi:hypothetical protein
MRTFTGVEKVGGVGSVKPLVAVVHAHHVRSIRHIFFLGLPRCSLFAETAVTARGRALQARAATGPRPQLIAFGEGLSLAENAFGFLRLFLNDFAGPR